MGCRRDNLAVVHWQRATDVTDWQSDLAQSVSQAQNVLWLEIGMCDTTSSQVANAVKQMTDVGSDGRLI